MNNYKIHHLFDQRATTSNIWHLSSSHWLRASSSTEGGKTLYLLLWNFHKNNNNNSKTLIKHQTFLSRELQQCHQHNYIGLCTTAHFYSVANCLQMNNGSSLISRSATKSIHTLHVPIKVKYQLITDKTDGKESTGGHKTVLVIG